MAKSRVQKLKDALERGDVEAAKKLAVEIEGQTARKAPRKPAKRRSTPRPSTVKTTPAEPLGGQEGPPPGSPLILPGNHAGAIARQCQDGQFGQDGQAQWMAPTRPGNREGRVAARHQSMQGRVHVNQFDDWARSQGRGVDGMDSRLRNAERKLVGGKSITPRPGMPGAARPPATKIPVYCDGCGRPFQVYPSELSMLDSESVYKCNRCIIRGK